MFGERLDIAKKQQREDYSRSTVLPKRRGKTVLLLTRDQENERKGNEKRAFVCNFFWGRGGGAHVLLRIAINSITKNVFSTLLSVFIKSRAELKQ